MADLDNLKAMKALDPGDMYSNIADLPEQFFDAWQQTKKLILPSTYIRFNSLTILGMGGSAIGGSFVKALVGDRDLAPITIIRDDSLPQHVDRNSLVIAVSYSGNTEETLTAALKAAEKGAKLIAITSNGQLERLAGRVRAPLFKITYGAQARAAIGYLFVPLLAIFTKLGLLEFSDTQMAETVELMRKERDQLAREIPSTHNRAKKLARSLQEKVVVLLGSGTLGEVSRRWKTQINENAKQAAFAEVVPELCHNTIVGLNFPSPQKKELYTLLFQSAFDNPRHKLRMSLLPTLFGRRNVLYEIVRADNAPNPFTELALLLLLGDFVSYYLAMLNGVDPTPIEPIEQLKKEMAQQ